MESRGEVGEVLYVLAGVSGVFPFQRTSVRFQTPPKRARHGNEIAYGSRQSS